MQQVAQTLTNWKLLSAWLLACPAMLAIAVVFLPEYTFLYGTKVELAVYLVILSLPLIGVAAILRLLHARRSVVVAAAIAYLCVCLLMVGATALIIGCSWARACF